MAGCVSLRIVQAQTAIQRPQIIIDTMLISAIVTFLMLLPSCFASKVFGYAEISLAVALSMILLMNLGFSAHIMLSIAAGCGWEGYRLVYHAQPAGLMTGKRR